MQFLAEILTVWSPLIWIFTCIMVPSLLFSNFVSFSISEGSILPDYLEVTTTVVVPHWDDRSSPSIFIFQSTIGILGSDRKQSIYSPLKLMLGSMRVVALSCLFSRTKWQTHYRLSSIQWNWVCSESAVLTDLVLSSERSEILWKWYIVTVYLFQKKSPVNKSPYLRI